MNAAIAVDGQVDRIERLHADPPVEWARTAWGVDEMDGDVVLVETAVIECPQCGGQAHWARGCVACGECDTRQKLIG